MADFQQRMKDWQRMCDSMQGGIRKCDNCPLLKVLCQYKPNEKADFAVAEQIIEKWAAEHPEPVYPTWEKYLVDLMTLDMMCDETDNPNSIENYMRKTPIPAEIAQKLGIEPKEGT